MTARSDRTSCDYPHASQRRFSQEKGPRKRELEETKAKSRRRDLLGKFPHPARRQRPNPGLGTRSVVADVKLRARKSYHTETEKATKREKTWWWRGGWTAKQALASHIHQLRLQSSWRCGKLSHPGNPIYRTSIPNAPVCQGSSSTLRSAAKALALFSAASQNTRWRSSSTEATLRQLSCRDGPIRSNVVRLPPRESTPVFSRKGTEKKRARRDEG